MRFRSRRPVLFASWNKDEITTTIGKVMPIMRY